MLAQMIKNSIELLPTKPTKKVGEIQRRKTSTDNRISILPRNPLSFRIHNMGKTKPKATKDFCLFCFIASLSFRWFCRISFTEPKVPSYLSPLPFYQLDVGIRPIHPMIKTSNYVKRLAIKNINAPDKQKVLKN